MDAQRLNLGTPDKSNVRTIYQFVHPKVLNSCQLVMGMTILETGSMWNTMPCHTMTTDGGLFIFRFAWGLHGFPFIRGAERPAILL